ncbi:MAG: SpoIID/LytB domain-containing protein [Myxococcota bacterium]
MRFRTSVRGLPALACLGWSLGVVALAGAVRAEEVRVLLLETRQTLAVGTARVAPTGGPGGRLEVDGQVQGPRWEAPGSGPHQVGDHHVRGRVEVERTRDGLRVINRVPLEAYVAGTLGAEMYARWEPAALQAQAVASRTYALYQQRRRRAEPYDVGTSTRDQVYRGLAAETPEIREAVAGTRGEVLLWKGEPILAAFHSASGGQTASAAEVWGRAVPYLRSRAVADEDASPHTYWRARIARTKLGPALAPLGLDLGAIRTLRVVGRTPSGRVAHVELVGSQGSERVTARALRTVLGASVLRSTLFEIRETDDAVSFVGSGHGHGVGMSQWGAQAMAERGAGYREILATFYPGTTLARRNP